uniref:Uncharacterized protein n=1 Tax=Romanomermis culicivorax TaxID=13658 RepID=A0A915JHS0_ROMCU
MWPLRTIKAAGVFAFLLIISAVLIVESSDQFVLSKGRLQKIDDEKSSRDRISVEFADEDYMSNYDFAEASRSKRFDHNAYAVPPDHSNEHNFHERQQQNEQMPDASPSPQLKMIIILIIVGVLIVAMIIVGAFICYLLMRDEKEAVDVLKEGEQAAAQQDQEQVNFVSQQESDKEKSTQTSGPVSSRSEREVDSGSLAEQLMDTFLSDTSRSKRSSSQSVA